MSDGASQPRRSSLLPPPDAARRASLAPSTVLPQPPSDPLADRAKAAADVEAITLKLRAERRERIIAQRLLKQSAGALDGQVCRVAAKRRATQLCDQVDASAITAADERADREKKEAMDALVAQVTRYTQRTRRFTRHVHTHTHTNILFIFARDNT